MKNTSEYLKEIYVFKKIWRFILFGKLLIILIVSSCQNNKEKIEKINVNSNLAFDFPAFSIESQGDVKEGYYFICTYKIGNYGDTLKTYQLILTHKGDVLYYRKTGLCFDFKMQQNGLISYYNNGKFYLVDSSFTLVDSVSCASNIETDLHDFQVLHSGNYLTIGKEVIYRDLSKYAIFMGKKIRGSKRAKVLSGVIQELDKSRNVIFEWHAKDYFDFEEISEFYLADTSTVDWTHFNAIDKDKEGNYLLTIRNFNQVIKIDGKTGAVVYKFGGKKNQFKFLLNSTPFLGLHDCRSLDNNRITLFDNGHSFERDKHKARALIFSLDEKQKTAKLIWQYKTGMFSKARGNFQLIDSNNYLINFGECVNKKATFCVVTKAGVKSLDLSFEDTLASYRSFFYNILPWHLKRPIIYIERKDGKLNLTSNKEYEQYHWSTGETTQTIEVKKPGKYQVFVPIGDGGFISSPSIIIDSKQLPKQNKK